MGNVKPTRRDGAQDIIVSPSLPLKLRKAWLTSIIGAIILIIIAGLVVFFINRNNTKTTATDACSSKSTQYILKEASPLLSPTVEVTKLQSLVSKIQQISNYQKDPNCLYPIVLYYINTSNAKESSFYLNEFLNAYGPGHGFSPLLGPVYPTSTLKADVAAIQQNAKNGQEDSAFGKSQ